MYLSRFCHNDDERCRPRQKRPLRTAVARRDCR
jgi:hypothetical protein